MNINYSIIIPHKNIPQLLERCLNSIPQREDVEVIVVDDNSDPEVVDFNRFPGLDRPQTKVYLTKEGKGAGYARNVGLAHAQGKWILFADADDFFTEELDEVLDCYRDAEEEVVLFPVKSADSYTLNEIDDREPFFNKAVFNETYSNQEKLAICCTPWSKLIKRVLVDREHIYFEEIRYANDVMFSAKIAIAAKHIKTDCKHYIYTLTIRNNSLITIKRKEALYIRLNAAIICNNYWKEHHHAEWMMQLNRIYLNWASQIGRKEVLKTMYILGKNGYLFFHGKYAWKHKHYNSNWYIILHALFCKI